FVLHNDKRHYSSAHQTEVDATLKSFSASDLFHALDGRSLTVSYRRWRIEIYGMFEQQGWRWVQLALRGDPEHAVIVRVLPHDGEMQVVAALSSWLANPSISHDQVLNVG